jgi:type IV pilus assembly protein PilM
MKQRSFFDRSKDMLVRAFPTPAYMTIPAAGVNISDYSIKHVYLAREKGGQVPHIVSHGKLDLPLGTVERGEIKDMPLLTKLLTRMRTDTGYEYIHLALPEEHAYLFQIHVPNGTREEVEQLLEFQLKENVPLGADEAVFDYNILTVGKDTSECNVSVYPIILVNQYLQVLHEAGLVPLSLEIEGQATARALLPAEHPEPTLIIDIGRNEASLSISTNGIVTFTATLETGGDRFTHAIARGLNLSFQEAERLKRQYGFRDTKESADVFEQLMPVVGEFKETIRKHLMYWQMHTSVGGNGVEEVSRVVLAGGNANVAGVAEYLEATLGVPVEIGNVWNHVLSFDAQVPNISATESLEYTTAVGLALRSLMRGQ